jgi:hypothetical protein
MLEQPAEAQPKICVSFHNWSQGSDELPEFNVMMLCH